VVHQGMGVLPTSRRLILSVEGPVRAYESRVPSRPISAGSKYSALPVHLKTLIKGGEICAEDSWIQ
jgi:hypothetical protein